MKRISVLIIMNIIYFSCIAQVENKNDSLSVKHEFPLDYKIAYARLDSTNYINDLEQYSKFVTPLMRKTQMSMSMVKDGIRYEVTPNSVYPNAQLDTNTILKNPKILIGKWEMLTFRMIEFKDSIDLVNNIYYRKNPIIIEERKDDIAYATFSEKKYSLYLKNKTNTDYSKVEGAKYSLENNRSVIFYKLNKSSGGISQIGIDEDGNLIINYPKVVTETNRSDKSHSYVTTITQKIFKRIKE